MKQVIGLILLSALLVLGLGINAVYGQAWFVQDWENRDNHLEDREEEKNARPEWAKEYEVLYYCLPTKGIRGKVADDMEQTINHELDEYEWWGIRLQCQGIADHQVDKVENQHASDWVMPEGGKTPEMVAEETTTIGRCERNPKSFDEAIKHWFYEFGSRSVLIQCQ